MSFRSQRERAGMSQGNVARKLGIDQSAVSLWETGKTYPTGKKMVELASLYDCTVDDLLAEDKEN